MDIQTLTQFFMWCTIMNGALLMVWAAMIKFVPDWLYDTQSAWFPIPRETVTVIMYLFLGSFKIIFLVFNVIPYVALLIVG